MAQAKSLAEMSVNTLMMVSFAVPGGAPFGAALAVGGFLIGIFWPDGAMPSQYEPINKADLDAAIASLKDFFLTVLNAAKIADTSVCFRERFQHGGRRTRVSGRGLFVSAVSQERLRAAKRVQRVRPLSDGAVCSRQIDISIEKGWIFFDSPPVFGNRIGNPTEFPQTAA